jgi:hypothetical protein
VITEFMPNPAAVGDADGEWFEIRANAAFDLNGLELGRESVETTVAAEPCLSVTAGDYALFARSLDSEVNGGLPAVDARFTFSLINSNGRLFVGIGGEVLDEVTWASSFNGASTSLRRGVHRSGGQRRPRQPVRGRRSVRRGRPRHPRSREPLLRRNAGGHLRLGGRQHPCDRRPGARRPGAHRGHAQPRRGHRRERRVVRDPRHRRRRPHGLQVGQTAESLPNTPTIAAGGPCRPVTAGSRIVLARNATAAENGGLDDVFATFSFNLVNSSGSLAIGHGGELLDAVTWPTSPTGASLSLDPSAEDIVSNDDPENFCAATSPYGDGDLGTPGDPNDPC